MAAISERAKLIAELIMLDKLSGPAKTATGSLGKLEAATSRVGKGIGFVGNTISTALGVGLQRAISTGISTLSSQFQQGVAGAEKLEQVTIATNQVLASTKGVAGQTASSIRDLALKYEDLNTTIDDKVIQSAENLLLTFTNVRGKAFEPALAAALNLNQALGGGEEGLQGTIIQVGKALQDPVRGLTALRRVGVAFSADQEKQIKSLVKQNKLYEAQQLIIGELNTEFGGQFAKAGQTSEAQAGKLRDAVDDLRISFAQGLLPGIDNVRKALVTTFRDPSTVAGITNAGKRLGEFLSPGNIQKGIGAIKDAFSTVVSVAKAVPWQAIGSALQLGGLGAQKILEAFKSAPPWLQTAIITGWGLNKITGGALTGIFGNLASGLIKGVLGINAGVVNVNAASVAGVGAAGAAGGLGSITRFLGLASAGALGVILGSEIAASINAKTVGPGATFEQSNFDKFLASNPSKADIQKAIQSIDDQFDLFKDPLGSIATGASYLPFIGDALGHVGPKLDDQKAVLEKLLATAKDPPQVKVSVSTPASGAAAQRLYNLPKGDSAKARESGPLLGLSGKQFLSDLARTMFIGAEGYKSIFERFSTFRGPGKGGDPFGQDFLALVKRLQNPKAPEVQFEIAGHLKELRNLESYYIAHGDIQAALKVQGVINSVDTLIGVTKTDNIATLAAHHAAIAEGSRTRAALGGKMDRLNALNIETAANTGVVARKNFSPTLENNVTVYNSISVRPINQEITRVYFGRYAGKPFPVGG